MIVTGRTRAASRCLAFLALIVLVAPPVHAFAPSASSNALSGKRVLFLHPLESNVPVGEFTDRGLRTALDAGGVGIRNQFLEFLDLARNPGLEHREKLVELMRLRYDHRKIDVIITMYPDGLRFLLNECATIFPDAPILALYMPERFDLPTTERRIIYNSPRPDIAGTFETALKLFPDTKHVYVIGGAHEMDKARQAEARRHFGKWEGTLEFRYLTNMPLEEILAAVSTTPPKTIVMILSFNNDSTGRVVTVIEAAKTVGQASNAPVFGLYDVMLGHGIVGGSLISYEHIGSRAGQVALDLLRGTKTPGNIGNDLDVPPEPIFDWRELKRWNVVMNAVPPGSLIINREYTLWERYRWAVIAALTALVLQAFLIVGLMVMRAHRQQAERTLADQLRLETLLAELSARFVNLPANQIESEIQEAQRRICEVLDLDRSTLWQVPDSESDNMVLTHIHTPSGAVPIPAPAYARDLFPWSLQRVLRGETLPISTLADLPPEAARDREAFQLYDTKSTVLIPISAEGTVLGALSFAMTRAGRDWPKNVVNSLQMIAQVMANAIVRKRTDQALQESEARLTLAAASADARMWELEADTGRIWMTEEGRAFFGVASNEALTLDRMASSIHPDDRESWRREVQRSLESGEPMHLEFRVVRPDGRVQWIVARARPHAGAAGKPNRLLGVSIDITERKRAEERLRTSEALSTGVLASLPGQMVIVDASGAILRASDSWQEFAAANGALDPTVLAVGVGAPPEKAGPVVDEIRRGIARVLTGAQAEFRLDYAYPTRTEEGWASISVLPLQRPEGGAVLYRQDITAQQRARLEAERLRRDLTHVSRVTLMGELTASLAHELNQPLTAIATNAHAGERYLTFPVPRLDEVREILGDVAADAQRAGEVIHRLRTLLKKDASRFLPLDVNQVVRDVAGLVHTDAIIRKVTIALDLAPELPPVRGDRVQLQQVLLNLVVNGMEAMGPQGEGKRIVIGTQRADGAVRVAVRDQGPGIPLDQLSRIFDTFYTTKPAGMGMGLAISRSIVAAHGGRLWTANNPDRGATFWFTVPAQES